MFPSSKTWITVLEVVTCIHIIVNVYHHWSI